MPVPLGIKTKKVFKIASASLNPANPTLLLLLLILRLLLFHELPRQARRQVASELKRILVPGGTVVIVDAAQQHASPELAPFLDAFAGSYHEPYFRSYQLDPLEDVLQDVGLTVTSTSTAFVSRVVVARRL